jgi:hypothetical protein
VLKLKDIATLSPAIDRVNADIHIPSAGFEIPQIGHAPDVTVITGVADNDIFTQTNRADPLGVHYDIIVSYEPVFWCLSFSVYGNFNAGWLTFLNIVLKIKN